MLCWAVCVFGIFRKRRHFAPEARLCLSGQCLRQTQGCEAAYGCVGIGVTGCLARMTTSPGWGFPAPFYSDWSTCGLLSRTGAHSGTS